MRLLATAVVGVLVSAGTALAWDAHGHRTIALLAVDQLERSLTSPNTAPADGGVTAKSDVPPELVWLFEKDRRLQVGYQSGEPDRYRAIRSPFLKHENDPDHYLDIEDLEKFGLTLATIPPLRYEYLRAMAVAKHAHPEGDYRYNERTDIARTQEWPGYLPYAITEHHGKLISSFRQVRVLAKLNDPARAFQMDAARANVVFEMGQLAHFVGDAAQPLHTTKHHHGWVDENPDGFTTNNGFHAYIDGTILGIHTLNYDTLKAAPLPARAIDAVNPFADTLAHIQRSFDQVRPLYVLQKSGDLEKEPGKAFITERLADGASTLAAYYLSAWQASAMTEKDASDFIRYDQESKREPNPMEQRRRGENGAAPQPTNPPATEPAAEPAGEPAVKP